MLYKVWSVECWGHAPKDCCASYSCRCVKGCPHCDGEGEHDDPCDSECSKGAAPCGTCEGKGETHDDDACDCGFTMNDRHGVGSVEFPEDATDDAIVTAMIEAGFIRSGVTAGALALDDNGNGFITIDDAATGEQLFQLEGDVT